MKKILITGGAGFIGSNLCKKLIKENHIICLDDLSCSSINNVKDLIKLKNFKFINHDISNPIKLKVDEIYNLACPASPINYQKDPIKTMKTNIYGALNTLNLSLSNNCKILQASTSEVYGDPLVTPQKETYWGNVNSVGIRSCYDEGKRSAETLFFDHSRIHKTKIKIVRIFNTYGPNMAINDGRVVSNFIVKSLLNKPIEIYGNGHQSRCFCYIDDLIEGLMNMMKSPVNFKGPVNIGSNKVVSVIDLAKKIKKITNSKSKIIFKEALSDDPKSRKPDLELCKNKLKWKSKVSIDEGIRRSVQYFKNEIF